MNKRPNIVYILQDHQAYSGHGMYEGGVKPKRPCFEAFAAGGIEFDNARCVTPMCGPARRTMLTALYPHNHKQVHNENDPPYDREVILDTLKENGYRSYYYGKWHAGPGAAAEHGAEGFSETGYGNPYLTEEYRKYLEENNLPPASHYVEYAFMADSYIEGKYFPGLEAGKDYKCETYWCGEHAAGITTTPKETHESFFIANLACKKLEEIAAEKSDEPFSMQVHFWGPHQPFFPTKEFADLYNPEEIGEYPSWRDTLEDQPFVFKMEASNPLGTNGVINIPSVLPWPEWQKILARAYGHISMIDAAGGMVVDKIRELGLDENTIIIWTTDHGDALASHGGHFDKNSHMSEEVMRVPLAIEWKGRIKPGMKDDHLVYTCDIPATMMDAAGLEWKDEIDGQSLLCLADNPAAPWRESLMCESYGHGYGFTLVSRMVVKGDWKYVITDGDVEQLYNLREDRWEMKNLAVLKEYREKVGEMREELRALMEKSHDPVSLDDLVKSVTTEVR